MNTKAMRTTLLGAAMTLLAATPVLAADTIKIAFVDPLSGPFANVGEIGLKYTRYEVDKINARGGVLGKKLELLPFDNKFSAQESLVALQTVINQKIPYVVSGNSSAVAAALIDSIAKHNARNPDSRVLYLNPAAQDPALNNDKCNFWHFRFFANSDARMEAITNHIKNEKQIQKIYLLNQDYAYGHAIAKAAREQVGTKRPDVKIVGEDLVAPGKVKDFSPYVAKMKAAGADTVITGNWGTDLSLLVRAAKDAGLNTVFYTFTGGSLGTPQAIGEAGIERVRYVSEYTNNMENKAMEAMAVDYKKKTGNDFMWFGYKNAIEMVVAAMEQAKSDDPFKVALALEGMQFKSELADVWMRKDDHQAIVPLSISTMAKVGGKVKYDVENTGFGFRTEAVFPAKDMVLPTTCKMERPAS